MTARTYNGVDYDAIYGAPLEAGQIRLLQLAPLHPRTATIHGTLSTCELRQSSFVAISYVWGRAEHLTQIRLNGKPFLVTQNAYHILRVLSQLNSPGGRSSQRELDVFADRLVWIDAICIDQHHVPEKESQVAQMREIYRAAQRTFIWLGSPQNPNTTPLAWFRYLVNSMPKEEFCSGPDARRGFWDKIQYASSCDMMRQPWFRRRWVMQEAAVSQEPLIVYGAQVIPWLLFDDAITRIAYLFSDQTHQEGLQSRPPGRNFDPMPTWAITRLRNADVGRRSTLRFVDIITQFRECATGQPLDRIYALIGLCKPSERDATRPNYTISPFNALIEFTINHIRCNDDLDILCIATEDARIARYAEPYWTGEDEHIMIKPDAPGMPEAIFFRNLPTWVPNLTSMHSRWKFGRDPGVPGDDTDPYFDASLGFPAEIHGDLNDCRESGELEVSAIELDRVAVVCKSTPVPDPDQKDPFGLVFEQMWDLVQRHCALRTTYLTPVALLTAFFRTLSAGGRRESTRNYLTDAFLRHYCLTFFRASRFGRMLIAQHGNEPRPIASAQYQDPNAGVGYNDNSNVTFDKLRISAFACTQQGRMALVPPLTWRGDRIFIVYGCSSPLLLHERAGRPGYYEVRGEAYIHGFMFGEAIRDEMEGVARKQIITLV